MQWYYVKNGNKEGPVHNVDLAGLVRRGEVSDETLVWNESMTDWRPYGEIKDQELPRDVQEEPVVSEAGGQTDCAMCGKSLPNDELIYFEGKAVCGNCKPNFIQQMKENAELSGALVMNYAGFWIRAGALFIDGIIIYVLQLPVGFFFGLFMGTLGSGDAENVTMIWLPMVLMYAVQMIIPAVYSIWMVGRYGATLGKKAVGIKIVTAEGEKLSYGRATGRYFAKIINSFTLNIGYLIAAFDDEKRGLHDHICSTRVIRK